MSKLNLNKPFDFALATMSAPPVLLDAFLRDKSEWLITEGAYQGGRTGAKQIVFHVFQRRADYQAGLPRVQDTMGRRKAKFRFPYVDGQTTDDLGRREGDFDFEIIFHGPTYRVGMKRLLIELNDPIPGVLTHPIWGDVVCAGENISLEHSHDMNNAVLMRVRFTEHAFETVEITDTLVIRTPRSALMKAIAVMQAIAAAIAALRHAIGDVIALSQKIQDIYNTFQLLAADAAAAFGLKGGDLVAILPIQQGGNLAPATGGRTAGGVNPNANPSSFGLNPSSNATSGVAGTVITQDGFILVSQRFTTVVQPTDPFANIPTALLSDVARQAIEITQLKKSADVLRAMVAEVIDDLNALIVAATPTGVAGIGAAAASVLIFEDTKITMLGTCVSMAELLNAGSQGGRPQIISYTVPHTMSIREAAFRNGLKPDDGNDIALLNPSIESVNQIDKGSVLLVPTFV